MQGINDLKTVEKYQNLSPNSSFIDLNAGQLINLLINKSTSFRKLQTLNKSLPSTKYRILFNEACIKENLSKYIYLYTHVYV